MSILCWLGWPCNCDWVQQTQNKVSSLSIFVTQHDLMRLLARKLIFFIFLFFYVMFTVLTWLAQHSWLAPTTSERILKQICHVTQYNLMRLFAHRKFSQNSAKKIKTKSQANFQHMWPRKTKWCSLTEKYSALKSEQSLKQIFQTKKLLKKNKQKNKQNTNHTNTLSIMGSQRQEPVSY